MSAIQLTLFDENVYAGPPKIGRPQLEFTKQDLVGRSFGKWKVIAFSGLRRRERYWLCKCECGIEKPVAACSLRKGKTTACPRCSSGNRKNIHVGKHLGPWTVIRLIGSTARRGDKWECECEFGHRRIIASSRFGVAHLKKCRQCTEAAKAVDKKRLIQYLDKVKASAASREIQFDLDYDGAIELLYGQHFRCALSGVPIDVVGGRYASRTTASLDRIDSSLSYSIDNIQWVHKDINWMKLDFPQARFVELCKMVAIKHE
jgi:hypothetical protein